MNSKKDWLSILRREGCAPDDQLVPLGKTNVFVRESGDSKDGTLVAFHNGGFYSCYSMLLQGILDASNMGFLPRRIDCRHTLKRFKDRGRLQDDVYGVFFAKPVDSRLQRFQMRTGAYEAVDVRNLPHAHYRTLPFVQLDDIVNTWFAPSSTVEERIRDLVHRYAINHENVIAVVYRGTDKGKEITLAPPEAYLELTRNLLSLHRYYRVLIQTDQLQVRRLFCDALKEKCFFVEELPATDTGTVMHKIINENKLDWAISLDATTRIISRAQIVINHTGNMGLFLALYRGSADCMYQFDCDARLIAPP